MAGYEVNSGTAQSGKGMGPLALASLAFEQFQAPQKLFSILVPALLYAGHLLFGGLQVQVALGLEIAFGLAMLAAVATPSTRQALSRVRWLPIPSSLFILTLAVCLLSVVSGPLGSAHPVWSLLELTPVATMDKSSTIIEIVKLLGIGCVFLIGAAIGGSSRRAIASLHSLLIIGAVFGLWAFLGGSSGEIDQTQGRRLEAHFRSPNTAGSVFAALLLIGIGIAAQKWRSETSRERLLAVAPWLCICLISLACVLASLSRGALAAVLLGLCLFGLLHLITGHRASLSRFLAPSLLGMGVVILIAGQQTLERLIRTPGDMQMRSAIWETHWQAFTAAPLLGYGLGTFETVNRTLLNADNFAALWNIRSAHNVYLQWIEEAGALGAAAMFACVGAIVAISIRTTLQAGRLRAVLAGLTCGEAVLLVHAATDIALHTYSVACFFAFILGVHFSLAQRESTRQGAARSSPLGPLLATAAATAALVSATAALCMLSMKGELQIAGRSFEKLSAGYGREVEGLLSQPLTPAVLSRAERLTRKSLALSPYDTGARMRLLYIDRAAHGTLTADGLGQLRLSYALVGVDPNLALWRIGVALDSWSSLDAETRNDVEREAMAVAQHFDYRPRLLARLKATQDPAGRLVAGFWTRRILARWN